MGIGGQKKNGTLMGTDLTCKRGGLDFELWSLSRSKQMSRISMGVDFTSKFGGA